MLNPSVFRLKIRVYPRLSASHPPVLCLLPITRQKEFFVFSRNTIQKNNRFKEARMHQGEKEGLNKESLIALVADKTGLSRTQVKKVVEEVFGTISECLAREEKFQYIGFGSFSVRKRAARTGVNPVTKEKIKIKAKKVPYFSPGKKLAEAVKKV